MMSRTTYLIAKEGWSYLAILALVTLLAMWMDVWGIIILALWIALGFSIYVFRNPERLPDEEDEMAILAPIDGTVEQIESKQECVEIILSVPLQGVHYLRAPMGSQVKSVDQIKGILLPLDKSESEKLNARSCYVLEREGLELSLQTLASMFAMGNGFYRREGEKIKAGERIGFFLHGKMVMHLPLNTRLKINAGDQILGGESLLGFLE